MGKIIFADFGEEFLNTIILSMICFKIFIAVCKVNFICFLCIFICPGDNVLLHLKGLFGRIDVCNITQLACLLLLYKLSTNLFQNQTKVFFSIHLESIYLLYLFILSKVL